MLPGPNTRSTHLSLSSKARSPSRATYRVWGINWSDALTCVVAAIFHRSVFRADIEASTLSGHSAIDATMTPDSHLLLRESIYTHRAPSLRCATPPRSAVFDAEEETPLHLWAHRRPPAAMSCKSSSGKARRESRSSRRRPQEGKRCHAIVWSYTAGPGLSPEESDPRAEEVGELHNGPQEESDIRRHRAVGFRPEQPYLRTLTLPDEDGGTPAPPACEPTGSSTSCAAAAPSPSMTTNLTAGRN